MVACPRFLQTRIYTSLARDETFVTPALAPICHGLTVAIHDTYFDQMVRDFIFFLTRVPDLNPRRGRETSV